MLEALRCRFCGGFINPRTYTCEYCGTVYMRPKSSFELPPREMVVVREAPIETIGAEICIPTEHMMYMDRGAERFVRNELASKFVDYIKPRMIVDSETNYYRMENIYRARLRIVKPDYKWGT